MMHKGHTVVLSPIVNAEIYAGVFKREYTINNIQKL